MTTTPLPDDRSLKGRETRLGFNLKHFLANPTCHSKCYLKGKSRMPLEPWWPNWKSRTLEKPLFLFFFWINLLTWNRGHNQPCRLGRDCCWVYSPFRKTGIPSQFFMIHDAVPLRWHAFSGTVLSCNRFNTWDCWSLSSNLTMWSLLNKLF